MFHALLCYTILYYTILYYTILYYTILYYTILYYTILYYAILYYTILYYAILYYTILCYTILYYTILYYTILYYTILYYTILYYTILYYTVPCQSCYNELQMQSAVVYKFRHHCLKNEELMDYYLHIYHCRWVQDGTPISRSSGIPLRSWCRCVGRADLHTHLCLGSIAEHKKANNSNQRKKDSLK